MVCTFIRKYADRVRYVLLSGFLIWLWNVECGVPRAVQAHAKKGNGSLQELVLLSLFIIAQRRLKWLKMEYYGRALEQAVDIAAPL